TGTTRASVLTFDAQGVMRFRASRGLSEAYRHAVEGHSPWVRGARDVPPVLVPDARADRTLAGFADLFGAERIGSLLFLPLSYQGELLGKLVLYFGGPHTPTADELSVAETIAYHVAFAVDRARVREAGERAAARTDRLQRLTASLATALTAAEVVTVLMREAITAFGAAAGSVALANELTGDLEIVHAVGHQKELIDAFRRMPISGAFPVT